MRTDSALSGIPGRASLALLCLLAAVPFPARAPAQEGTAGPATLSLEDAIALARRNNPRFRSIRNDESVADWEVRSAYASLLPAANVFSTVMYQGSGEQRFGSLTLQDFGLGRLPGYYLSSYSAGLDLSLSLAKLVAPAEAKARRDATRARIGAAELELILGVTRQYLQVLRAEEGEKLARQELERARENLRLARARREVGTATALDVRQAEVAAGQAEVALLQARNEVQTARLRLIQQLGIDFRGDFRLTTEFHLFEPRWSEEELFERAVRRNPSLASVRASERAAAYGVQMARSAYLPSLSMSAGVSGFTREADDPAYLVRRAEAAAASQMAQCEAVNMIFARLADPLPPQDCSAYQLTEEQRTRIRAENDAFPFDFTRQPAQLSLTVSVPIFQGLGRQRELERAKVAREDVRLQLREEELRLRTDVATGLATLRTAYEAARLQERNREVAAEQLRLARERYRLGAASFIELVEAETVTARAERDYLDAVFAFHDALASLEAVVGERLRAGKPGDEPGNEGRAPRGADGEHG